MKVLHSSKQFHKKVKRSVLVLGNFDGLHLAHQEMFRICRERAKQCKAKPVVYTLNPHPAVALSLDSSPRMIMTLEQKIEVIKNQKMKALILEKFDKNFASLKPKQWFEEIILKNIAPQSIVVGYDFTFGHKRSGNVSLLKTLCEQNHIELIILEAFLKKDNLVSSSQIRNLIKNGNVKAAKEMMGRCYYMDGFVVKGLGRGKKIGIPTANLAPDNELNPALGVYRSAVKIGRKIYASVSNVGINPTFGNDELSIETYLFDFKKNIYGKRIRLYFLDRIRAEKKFSSVEELVDQIHSDIKNAKRFKLPNDLT